MVYLVGVVPARSRQSHQPSARREVCTIEYCPSAQTHVIYISAHSARKSSHTTSIHMSIGVNTLISALISYCGSVRDAISTQPRNLGQICSGNVELHFPCLRGHIPYAAETPEHFPTSLLRKRPLLCVQHNAEPLLILERSGPLAHISLSLLHHHNPPQCRGMSRLTNSSSVIRLNQPHTLQY